MLKFDLQSWTAEPLPQVLNDPGDTGYFFAGWSTSLKSMIFTGNGTEYDMSQVFAYDPHSGWRALTTSAQGVVPSPRFGSCVAQYGDSKIVSYGGRPVSGKGDTVSDIYVFDLTKLT